MTPAQGGTPFTRTDHKSHGTQLLAQATQSFQDIGTKEDAKITSEVILAIATARETSINAQKSNLRKIGLSVISVDTSDNSKGIAAIERSQLKALHARLDNYTKSDDHRGKTYFAPIESIKEVDPETKIDKALLDGENHSCIIYLYPNFDTEEQNRILQEISFKLSQNHTTTTKFLKTSVSGYALTATLPSQSIRDLAYRYNSIRAIRLNSTLRLEKSTIGNPISPTVIVAPPTSDLKVAVVDSGVAAGSKFISHLVAGRHANLPSGAILDTSHGHWLQVKYYLG